MLSKDRARAFRYPRPPAHEGGWYARDDPDTHRTGWTITGPRKDIVLATTFRRGGA
jgi:hypothetical protein